MSGFIDLLFGDGPDMPDLPDMPEIPEPKGTGLSASEKEAEEKKRKAAAAKGGREGTILTSGVKLGEPEIGKKTLLGA